MSFQAAFEKLVHYSLTYVELRIIISYGSDINLKSTCSGISVSKHQILSCFACVYVNTHKLHLIFLPLRTTSKLTFTLRHQNISSFRYRWTCVSADRHKTEPPLFGAKTSVFIDEAFWFLFFSHINPPKTNVNKQENEL